MLPRKQRVHPAARIAIVKKYLASDLTQREFCQQEKLAYPTFLAWLRKYRAAESQSPHLSPAAPSFVPLQLEPSACLHQARRAASCTLEFPNGVLVHFTGYIVRPLYPPIDRSPPALRFSSRGGGVLSLREFCPIKVPWSELPFCIYFQLISAKAGTGKVLKLPYPSPGFKMSSPGGYF